MPEKLKVFLKSLTPIEANEIFEYFDNGMKPDMDEMDEILYEKIQENPELWDETFGNSIHDDRDATSIHD